MFVTKRFASIKKDKEHDDDAIFAR